MYIKAPLLVRACSGTLAGDPLALLLRHVDKGLLALRTLGLGQQAALLLGTRALNGLSLLAIKQTGQSVRAAV